MARITSRAQTTTEEQKARRQAYSACATALLARRDAAAAFLDVFKGDDFDQAAVQAMLREVDEQRDPVARAVGAVAIEGPSDVTSRAEFAAKAIELLSGRIRDWTADVAGGRDRDELLRSVRAAERQVGVLADQRTHALQVFRHQARDRAERSGRQVVQEQRFRRSAAERSTDT
ncbi:hypothetical protein ACH4UM_34375 [Streptomyces sp. NPDC020801]|uniref:hypothetical protein n=1 Tax=Streptomyces sp. NPDC020801 TaxID=3365093 RepID=UPI00379405A0